MDVRYSARPLKVTGLTGFAGLSAGGNHTCARKQGRIFCWGRNLAYESGSFVPTAGPDYFSAVIDRPTEIPGGFTDVVALQAGEYHNCLLRTSGQVYCWGHDSGGKLGIPPVANVAVPQVVPNIAGVTEIGQTHFHNTCVVNSNNSVSCWGLTPNGTMAPGIVLGLSGFTNLIAFGGICGLYQERFPWCMNHEGAQVSPWPKGTFPVPIER